MRRVTVACASIVLAVAGLSIGGNVGALLVLVATIAAFGVAFDWR